MDIAQRVAQLPEAQLRQVLTRLLSGYTSPAFGVLPKLEQELAMLEALQALGLISAEPGLYELVSQLRVTRAKARNLLYALELRRASPERLDGQLRALLRAPLLLKQGELFALEIESPLLIDHLKARLQQLGHASDGAFSSSLVSLKLEALVALIASCLGAEEQERLRRALVKAGAPDTSFAGIVAAALKKLAGKLADKAGEAALGQLSDYLGPLLDASAQAAGRQLGALFKPAAGP